MGQQTFVLAGFEQKYFNIKGCNLGTLQPRKTITLIRQIGTKIFSPGVSRFHQSLTSLFINSCKETKGKTLINTLLTQKFHLGHLLGNKKKRKMMMMILMKK